MSVLLAEAMQERGRGPEQALAGHNRFRLVSFTAALARACRQGIARDPLPTEPSHALVVGKKTKAVRKRFAEEAVWVIPPQA